MNIPFLSGGPWSGAVLAAHAAVASTVSLHVLWRKRDVGAAVGWIGLAWLSPFLGGGLYYMLGINRVHRRARRLRSRKPPSRSPREHVAAPPDNALGALEHAAHQISRRPSTRGNSVTMLRNGDEAYPKMLAAIDAAQSSIALTSYIFRDDAAGGPLLDAIIRAHARGVAARVLIDGIGGGYFSSPAWRRLREAGVPAGRFMHTEKPWQMPFINLRTHKKLLVVDGTTAFTGGLNIGAENVVALGPPHPVRDTHFLVAGPVVAQLVDAFAQDWQFTNGESLEGDLWFPPLTETGPCIARVVTSGPDREVERIELLALMAITCARRSVAVMTPYFLPDERIITALSLAAMRGLEIDILIPARSNQRLVDWATRADIVPLLSAGCRIWRNPPPFDHSKLMVVDGEWALIGSANWDMRSFRLNFELTVAVTHSGLAAELQTLILDKCHDRLTANELAAAPVAARLRDAAVRLLLPYL